MTTLATRSADLSNDWADFDAKARAQESAYESAALGQFRAEALAVVRMLESNIPSLKALAEMRHHDDKTREYLHVKKADPIAIAIVWPYIEAAMLKVAAAYSSVGTFTRQWYNRFRPIIAKTMAQATPPTVRVGILGPTSPQMLSAIQRRVTKLSGQVTETTLQQIRDVVTQARNDGVGIQVLATRIRNDVFADTITQARATTIARTETVGALNEGAWVRATATGVFRAKSWVTQRDGRVRDSHKALDGVRIPINDRFANGLLYPHESGAPPNETINCRCTLKFYDELV